MLEPWERDLCLQRATTALEMIANRLLRLMELAEAGYFTPKSPLI